MKAINRLDKWLSLQTQYSRREIKLLAKAGKIRWNEQALTDTAQKIEEGVELFVDGEQVILQSHLYLMMNKPAGVVSATQDNLHQTVIDILPKQWQRRDVFPAGRLDKDTEGFLFLTNDGPCAHRATSPNYKVPKTYVAELVGEFDTAEVTAAFAAGLALGEEKTSPAKLVVISKSPTCTVHLTIHEGLFHQVKRMFGQFEVEVVHLKRIQIGRLSLDERLPLACTRELSAEEVTKLLQNS